MATYLVLNLVLMSVVIIVLRLLGALSWNQNMTRILVVLLVLTAVFDSVMIAAGIFSYDPAKILGLRLGLAPIEDFMYTILVVIMVPAIWKWLGGNDAR